MQPKILVITGPTATGKTAQSVALAKRIGGEIVSADSMQIYKYMDIGTAKPTTEEMAGVPHHMLGVITPFENYSVARYVEAASNCVDDILGRGKLPIVVGGTGLYIEALVAGRVFSEQEGGALRQELSARYDTLGGDVLFAELCEVDPMSAGRLHPNDKKRIIRALEITASTAGNWVIESALLEVREKVHEGIPISQPISENPDFPPMVGHMIKVGEETGELDKMLGKVADFYEDEVDTAIQTLTSIIEPVMMICVGLVVGVIIISMYLPMFKMLSLVK
jgi:hypothetical protein